MQRTILGAFALSAIVASFFMAVPAVCEEEDRLVLAALEISANIKKFRDNICQHTDAVLACHLDYSEALGLVAEIEAIGRKQSEVSYAESIELQKTIDNNFTKINQMLAEFRKKYGT